jgi:hypothetical protein
MLISNDAKLNMIDGAYQDFEDPLLNIPEGSTGCGRGQAPHGNAPHPPPHPLVSMEQLVAK